MFNIVTVFLVAVGLQLTSVNGQDFTPKVPSECQALGYCDRPLPDYPNEAVRKLVKESALVSPGVVDVTELSRRQGVQDPSEVNLCDYENRIILPQVAQDTSGKWNYVVNTQEYKQGYRVQICKNVNSQCSQVANFYVGYKASCQQRFINVVMVALAENGQKAEKDFKIPSNCYCQVMQE
ncbi:protein spaetzle 5-like [Choristoneura fumiferana]|uniref:protein spaetzle 5-like n=1 Tax=Choristoneura fumiferana TaxID=7141 RepID=UPI003D154094